MTDRPLPPRMACPTRPAPAALAASLGLGIGDRVVAFWPHPDDEAWAAAWTLRGLCDAGVRLRLVFATDGEAASGSDADAATQGLLRAARRAEAEAAAASLGCEEVVFLDRGDGHLAVDLGLADALASALPGGNSDRPANAVLSFGDDGGYPHRDHVALTAALTHALAALGPLPWWQTSYAPGLFAPLLHALRRHDARGRTPPLLDAAWPLARVGAPAKAGDVWVRADGESARTFKAQAIACHTSQLPGGDPLRLLGPGVVEALMAHGERWRRAPPPGGEGAKSLERL